jgi:hypothetical protein
METIKGIHDALIGRQPGLACRVCWCGLRIAFVRMKLAALIVLHGLRTAWRVLAHGEFK